MTEHLERSLGCAIDIHIIFLRLIIHKYCDHIIVLHGDIIEIPCEVAAILRLIVKIGCVELNLLIEIPNLDGHNIILFCEINCLIAIFQRMRYAVVCYEFGRI